MCHTDQQTLPGLPTSQDSAFADVSAVPEGSPIHQPQVFSVVAAQAVASALLDALVVYSPSFCSSSSGVRSLSALRFLAASLDTLPESERLHEIEVVRERLDCFLLGGADV